MHETVEGGIFAPQADLLYLFAAGTTPVGAARQADDGQ